MKLAFYGPAPRPSRGNGAGAYYRGTLRSLVACGYDIRFHHPHTPDAGAWDGAGLSRAAEAARDADIVIQSGEDGDCDHALMDQLMRAAPHAIKVWWDMDAPATLSRLSRNEDAPLRRLLPRLDAVLTYGGGADTARDYRTLGAQRCAPVYNALYDDECLAPARPHAGVLAARTHQRRAGEIDQLFRQLRTNRQTVVA